VHVDPRRNHDEAPLLVTLKFDVFGRDVLVTKGEGDWKVYYCGSEGKRRPATDIVIPNSVAEADICRYLADLCHEWATSRHPEVKKL
jgi:hypothetical protein